MPFSKAPHPSRRFASGPFPLPASRGEGIRRALPAIALLLPLLWPAQAQAAELNGAELLLPWAVPFLGILLSIALLPLLAHDFWEHHQGKIAAFWAALVLLPLFTLFDSATATAAIGHAIVLEYIPFILLLLALFTVAGGIVLRGNLHGSPAVNTGLLAIGSALASFTGTTGAAMVMIRPLLRANDDRKRNAHVVIFFIFLVANIGGSLTPLGDPPLFLGFLRGVDFFWTTEHLFLETLFLVAVLLVMFFILDSIIYRQDGHSKPDPTPDDERLRLSGGLNIVLLGVIIGAILLSASASLGTVRILGVDAEIANILRDLVMITVTFVSLAVTPKADREANAFSWEPIKEVAKLFAGIFITIIPVLAMLKAGQNGVFAPLVALVSSADGSPNTAAYFWLTGMLSAFLDNAPTYLVFFELGGGDPQELMYAKEMTLTAISAGAVFMGALTYIGNAPNFMVYSIARRSGVNMPGFFGYMLWSVTILLPLFALLTFIFYM
ncbi:sodium:proton antiporter [Nordella sp. HKS 07]|uniref:sodium:proton antiporter n=1 Tax=Nordella sp. HKS 07 TaxID=2712222 RepID=UPI0013E18CCF|nr:sodium:proton antiporter [Nordella sp. HKS 07]QIG47036.1 sodium:proton antiporter [Nordella sp. HKS 07]